MQVNVPKDTITNWKVPIIAAVKDKATLLRAVCCPIQDIFIIGSNIFDVAEMVRIAKANGKRVFLHIDLVDGIGKDFSGVEYCAKVVKPDGLISTRAPLLKRASNEGLITIQRLFLVDSSSLEHGVRLLKAHKPDYVEVLPGLLPKAITYLKEMCGFQVIAGGMVTEADEVKAALTAGACGVSTSNELLWSGKF